MQVTSDGTLKFTSCRTFKSRKGDDLYLVEMYDKEEKRNVQFFAEGRVYSMLLSAEFGQEFSCVFSVSMRSNGFGCYLIDLVG